MQVNLCCKLWIGVVAIDLRDALPGVDRSNARHDRHTRGQTGADDLLGQRRGVEVPGHGRERDDEVTHADILRAAGSRRSRRLRWPTARQPVRTRDAIGMSCVEAELTRAWTPSGRDKRRRRAIVAADGDFRVVQARKT